MCGYSNCTISIIQKLQQSNPIVRHVKEFDIIKKNKVIFYRKAFVIRTNDQSLQLSYILEKRHLWKKIISLYNKAL